MKAMAILMLLGFMALLFVLAMGSLTGPQADGSLPIGTWATLAVLAALDIAAIVAVIRQP